MNVLHDAEFADGDWKLLAHQLIDHPSIITIRENHPHEVSYCMIDTISQWLRTDPESSWEKLAKAIKKVKKYGESTAKAVLKEAGIRKTGFA